MIAGVALLLAVAGLYGVLSYDVAHRTREIGIRSALGSSPRRTLGLVMRQGMLLLGTGVLFGWLGGWGLTGLLESLLYGVSPLDLFTWLTVTVVLIGVGALAILLPARRASRVAPMIALRTD